MVKWNSSPHPISDIRDWSDLGRLELRPDFQRKEVWSEAARIMLMDTILAGIPMPKVFLATEIREGKTHRIVIDGQQRLTSILAFLRDEFALGAPYNGTHTGKVFSNFTVDEANEFLSYKIDFNEAVNPSDKEVREVYSRVNKYTVALNKQELRRADYPGDFLNVSEELSLHAYLEEARIFSTAQRRRYGDVEFVSEILTSMLMGIQDKQGAIDVLYRDLAAWPKKDREATIAEFESVISDLKLIFAGWPIAESRFRQKADFYSIFGAITELRREGGMLEGKDLGFLVEDLRLLDFGIEPESHIALLSEYAIKCVSQANTIASRTWRHNVLKAVLTGTYHSRPPDGNGAGIFFSILSDAEAGDVMCPSPEQDCPICEKGVASESSGGNIAWARGEATFQISNACFIHADCRPAAADEYRIVEVPAENDDRHPNLL